MRERERERVREREREGEREQEEEKEGQRERERERKRVHEGSEPWRRARAASPLTVPTRTGDLRKIALAVSRWRVSPKFCSALRASTAVDSPDTSEIALPSLSQTFAAAGPHAPEWASTTMGTKAIPSLAQWAAVSKNVFLKCS